MPRAQALIRRFERELRVGVRSGSREPLIRMATSALKEITDGMTNGPLQ